MGDEISDNFYSKGSISHRVSSVSYNSQGESVGTFCDESFPIDSEEEIFSIPIKLLDRTEVCIECERNYSYIGYDQFNFQDNDKEYKFFVQATLKLGEKKGIVIQETVEADSVEEAKSLVEDSYERADLHKYYYIARAENYGQWDILTDKRRFSD